MSVITPNPMRWKTPEQKEATFLAYLKDLEATNPERLAQLEREAKEFCAFYEIALEKGMPAAKAEQMALALVERLKAYE